MQSGAPRAGPITTSCLKCNRIGVITLISILIHTRRLSKNLPPPIGHTAGEANLTPSALHVSPGRKELRGPVPRQITTLRSKDPESAP